MSDEAPADAALAYVKFVMAELKLSASALAKLAGISASTLTRPLNSQTYKFAPSLITLAKIGKASGIDPSPFLSAENFRDINMVPYTRDIYDDTWGDNFNNADIGLAVAIGDAAAGEWKELEIASFHFAVPVRKRGNDSFSLIAKGKSTDLIAREGDIILCTSTSAIKKDAKEYPHPIAKLYFPFNRNCALAIERRSEDRRLVEISVRYPIWTSSEWHFICPSSDPLFRKPIVRSDLSSYDHFVIIGQVSWVLVHTALNDALMQRMMLTE